MKTTPIRETHPVTAPVEHLAEVEHPAFPSILLTDPINWAINPYQSTSWQHHFMSLRWISTNFDSDKLFEILKSFYRFHCVRQAKNPYYNQMRGDHAGSIRLRQLISFRDRFLKLENVPATGICDRLIKADIDNLQSSQMYRHGHNHGLMVDILLLQIWKENPRFRLSIKADVVAARGLETLNKMFDENGITLEHSISYQEHNYPLAIQFLELHPNHQSEDVIKRKKKLETTTKRILAWALRDAGEYFAMGDTLRTPSAQIRTKHPEIVATPRELSLLGTKGNRLYTEDGFFFYKRKFDSTNVQCKNIHFSATCGWNSINHKQDDELSFCLEVDGNIIFDDPGYTVNIQARDERLRKSSSHSTVEILNSPFCDAKQFPIGSSITSWLELDDGFTLNMSHQRIAAHLISRQISLQGDTMGIRDSVTPAPAQTLNAAHNFVLHPEINIQIENTVVLLYKSNVLMAEIRPSSSSGEWQSETIDYIGTDKYKYLSTIKLSFHSSQKNCEFQIKF